MNINLKNLNSHTPIKACSKKGSKTLLKYSLSIFGDSEIFICKECGYMYPNKGEISIASAINSIELKIPTCDEYKMYNALE